MLMENISKDEFYKMIGQNVAKVRNEKGLSQLELSLKMNFKSISIVSSAEIYYRKKHFNLEHLLIISQILKVDIHEFFKESM
jgi:transcriptional regulator with XRE-family HTH domain